MEQLTNENDDSPIPPVRLHTQHERPGEAPIDWDKSVLVKIFSNIELPLPQISKLLRKAWPTSEP